MRTGTLHVLFGFFGALFVASQANILAQAGPVATDILQLQLTASPESFRDIVQGWSPAELARYRSHFAWDTVHPLVYGGFLVLWTLVAHRRRRFVSRTLRVLLFLAVAPSVLDYVENAMHLYLEVNRGSINSGTVLIAATAATLKWLCAASITVLLGLASFRALLTPRGSSATSGGNSAPGRGTVAARTGAVPGQRRTVTRSVADPVKESTGRPAEPAAGAGPDATTDKAAGTGGRSGARRKPGSSRRDAAP
jgi:hypothetical protein